MAASCPCAPRFRSAQWLADGEDYQVFTMCQLIDKHQLMNTVAVVTGATRNLGLALAMGLAQRLTAGDAVYLTGPDPARVSDVLATLPAAQADVHGAVVDVAEADAVARFAASLDEQHGGVDIVSRTTTRGSSPVTTRLR
jgi:hypothetical protein